MNLLSEGETFEAYMLKHMSQLSQFTGTVLTPEEKEWRVHGYEHELEDGRIDEELIPYIERINEFPFIVTTQSCSGHGEDPAADKQAHIDFRSSLTPKTVVEELLIPMDKEFGTLGFNLALEADRCRYIIWFIDNVWEDKLKYFITLLEGLDGSGLEKEAVVSTTPGAWSATHDKKPVPQFDEEAYLAIPPEYEQVDKAWSDEARRAALEARRRKARAKPEEPKGRTKKPEEPKTPKRSKAEQREAHRKYVASILTVDPGIAADRFPDSPDEQRHLGTAITYRVELAIEKLPKEHTHLVKKVNVKRELQKVTIRNYRGTKLDKEVKPSGQAFFKTQEIDIASSVLLSSKERTASVVAHEVGHFVQENMDGTNKAYWRDYYRYMKDTMSTDYGKTNDLEGFATNYANMINPKTHNPDDLNEQVVRLYSGQKLKISRDKFKSMIKTQGLPEDLGIEILYQYDLLEGLET